MYTLYSYWRSSASWRIRVVLLLKGIPFTIAPVNLLASEQLSPEYLAVHPGGSVPCLEIDKGVFILQSLAIFQYLESAHPNSLSLVPKTPLLIGRMYAIVDMICSDIHAVQNLRILKKVDDRQSWAHDCIKRGFDVLEKVLAGGIFCVGNHLTYADACLVPQIYNAERFKVDMSAYPKIVAIASHLNGLDEFKKAHPSVQVDCSE